MNLVRSLLLTLLLIGSAIAQKTASLPEPTGYVDDYAGVISPDAKADIDEICHEIHAKANAQIFFVTVESLKGQDIETYANDLFHQWKIGDKATDRGILVLLSVKDHKRRIEVGYGLEGILPDAKVGAIGRDMVPALKAEDYDRAGKLVIREISNVIAEDAKVSLTSSSEDGTPSTQNQTPSAVPLARPIRGLRNGGTLALVVLFTCFVGIFGLILWSIVRRARSGYAGGPGFSDSGSGSSVGSGDSGGTSDSGSSDSFSGGDGGDSGGGGASGDW